MKHKCCFEGCSKKIKLVESITNKCKCGHIFCNSHKHPESHDCQFDYKAAAAAEIMKNACPTAKLEKI